MNQTEKLYEFAASAGALEGYVYHKKDVVQVDMDAMDVWTLNLVEAYRLLPEDIKTDIRNGLDKTLNRAVSSLNVFLEPDHPVLKRVVSMLGNPESCSPDDFQKKKWFQEKNG